MHAKKDRVEPGGMTAARKACAHSFSSYPNHERGIPLNDATSSRPYRSKFYV